MALTNVNVVAREEKGKGHSRRLRDRGVIPAVIYGKGADDVPIEIPQKELKGILKSETGRNTIINLRVQSNQQMEEHTVMIREIQQDPVKGMMLHADFYEIDLNKRVTANVPIHVVGDSEGVKRGGILQLMMRELQVECLPTQIPEIIELDITQLDLGDKITVGEIPLSTDVKYLSDRDAVVATIMSPRMAEEPTEVEPENITETGVAPQEGEADTKTEEA